MSLGETPFGHVCLRMLGDKDFVLKLRKVLHGS